MTYGMIKKVFFLCIIAVSLWACQPTSPAQNNPLLQQGRTTYLSQCISCHNSDPKKDGAMGPAVFGSSRELLEARIMKGTYPENYAPKRSSTIMQPLPHLKKDLEALTIFLNHTP